MAEDIDGWLLSTGHTGIGGSTRERGRGEGRGASDERGKARSWGGREGGS